ncbi:MAG: ABC transporter permease [Planctomycetes bacterium]|nr:ABC transporter permease [Planctomycetota bacterium]
MSALTPAPPRFSLGRLLARHPEIGVLIVLCLFMAYFGGTSPKFLGAESLTAMLTAASEVGMIALGVSILMISGEFDISIGSVMGFSTLIFCWLANSGVPAVAAMPLTLAACALVGVLNGLITLRLGIPSFITTLGTMLFWRGLHSYITEGFVIMYDSTALERDRPFLNLLGGNPFSMFHMTSLWFVVLTISLHLVLVRTAYGNHVFATGGNREAARNAGVKVDLVKLFNFMLCSLLAGFTGTANLARYASSHGQLGAGIELEAIAACVIGGNELAGGAGSIIGTFMGAILMSIIRTGLIGQGVSPYLYLPLTGLIIIAAVVLNKLIRRWRA